MSLPACTTEGRRPFKAVLGPEARAGEWADEWTVSGHNPIHHRTRSGIKPGHATNNQGAPMFKNITRTEILLLALALLCFAVALATMCKEW